MSFIGVISIGGYKKINNAVLGYEMSVIFITLWVLCFSLTLRVTLLWMKLIKESRGGSKVIDFHFPVFMFSPHQLSEEGKDNRKKIFRGLFFLLASYLAIGVYVFIKYKG
ncbi:hypothetical protein ACWJJH_00560 [Endozoicomonadaceae bacterium StTr2]